jgi:hypothetical protein
MVRVSTVGFELDYKFLVEHFSLAVSLRTVGCRKMMSGALELGQDAEELAFKLAIAIRDMDTGNPLGIVELVMQGICQLGLVHGLGVRHGRSKLCQPASQLQAEIVATRFHQERAYPIQGYFLKGVFRMGNVVGPAGAWLQGMLSWQAQQLKGSLQHLCASGPSSRWVLASATS